MAWSSFTTTTAEVAAYDPNLNLTADKLLDFIDQAQSDVEDKLKILIYTKYRDAGYTLPDDLPDPTLDAILSDAYPQIRKLVIYKALEKAYAKSDVDMSTYWESQYAKVGWDDITIFIDVDQDGTLDIEEFLTVQDQLDDRVR
jgi:hypothetical protein